jgi:hypothetical protein
MSHRNLTLAQTGRTTRMREKAVQLAMQGRAVYILVLDQRMVKLEAAQIDKLWNRFSRCDPHGIKVEAFDEHWHSRWNWNEMKPTGGFNPNCEFLMDHTVVELKLDFVHKQMAQLADFSRHLYYHTV